MSDTCTKCVIYSSESLLLIEIHCFVLARPAFSIDSLLQRKVVNNHHISDKIQYDAQVETCIGNPMESSAMASKCSSRQTTEGDVPITSPSINPLESLTFENILKSAAIQQQKNKGKLKY